LPGQKDQYLAIQACLRSALQRAATSSRGSRRRTEPTAIAVFREPSILFTKVIGPSKDILEVFRITQLDKILEIHDNQKQALKAFERSGWFG